MRLTLDLIRSGSTPLQEKIQQYREEENRDERWEELALLRTLLQDWISDLEEVSEEKIEVARRLQESIRKTLDSINKIRTRSALTAAEVEYLQAKVADIFRTYVPERNRDDALEELQQIGDARARRN